MNAAQLPGSGLLASEDGLVAPLSNSECVFQLRRTGENHVMTYQVLKAMDACRQFRTMDEHVQAVAGVMPELQQHPEAIRQVLDNLVSRNLLTNAGTFMQETFGGDSKMPTAPAAGIFVRTKDRPDQLRRLLDSALSLEERFGQQRRIFVIDDSRDTDAAQNNEAAAVEFSKRSGAGAVYLGKAWRSQLVESLNSEFPLATAEISWLLGPAQEGDGFTGGQALNAALLASAGRRFMLFDDDFQLSARAPAGANPRILDLLPASSSGFADFFRAHEEVMLAGNSVESDPLANHERLCGASLSGLLTDGGFDLSAETLKNREVKALRNHMSGATIKTTHMGTYGHSGAGSNAWVFLMPAASRAQLWQSEDAYRAIMEQEWVMRGVSRATLTTRGVYAPVGVDNTTLVPFAAPTGRGEDFHFASVLKLLYPASVDLEMPRMMAHFRPEGTMPTKPVALTPPLSRFVGDFAGNVLNECRALEPAERYHYLASALRDQAAAPNLERQRILREYLSHARARLIEQLNRTLVQAEGAPDYWSADVKMLIDANGTALLNGGAPKLRGWHRQNTARACADRLSEELQLHARAMAHWPDLWHFCQQGDGCWLAG